MNFTDQGGARPAALLPRPDGSILVGANVDTLSGPNRLAYVARLRSDGTRDMNFGGGGDAQAFLFAGAFDDALRRLVPVGDGRVLAAGTTESVAPGDTFRSLNFVSTRFALDPGIIAEGRQTGPAVEGGSRPVTAVDSSYAGGSIVKYEWDADYQGPSSRPTHPARRRMSPSGTIPPPAAPCCASPRRTGWRRCPPRSRWTSRTCRRSSIRSSAPAYAPFQTEVAFSGFASDPADPRDTLDVMFDYGDGSGPVRTSVATLNGRFVGSHVYSVKGTYTARVTISDGDGGSTMREATVHVVDVAGNAFRDLDDDGTPDSGEPPIASVTVFVDTDGDGARDDGEPSTTSDAAGNYWFDGLPAGSFGIFAVRPRGCGSAIRHWTCGRCRSGRWAVSRNFGLTDAARIMGTVVNDLDADGVRDPGEPGLAMPNDVFLDLDDDGFYDTGEPLAAMVEAAPNGTSYVFRNVAPGTYEVRVLTGLANTNGTSYVQSFPTSGGGHTALTVTVGLAQVAAGNDFGIVRATRGVTGIVFEDRNRSGGRDPGEAGLGGRVVYLDADNDGILDPDESRVGTLDGLNGGSSVGPYTMMVPAGATAVCAPAGDRRVGADRAGGRRGGW